MGPDQTSDDERLRRVGMRNGILTQEVIRSYLHADVSRLNPRDWDRLLAIPAVDRLELNGCHLAFLTCRQRKTPLVFELHNCVIDTTDLQDLNAAGSSFERCTFPNAAFLRCDLSGCRFDRSILCDLSRDPPSGAVFSHSRLARAWFIGADLRGADFENADLQNAQLPGARLERANFADALLYRTRFERSALGKALVQQEARGDIEPDLLTARSIYINLKQNFESTGAYRDAAWAYIRERTVENESYRPEHCSRLYAPELEGRERRMRERFTRLWEILPHRRRPVRRELPKRWANVSDALAGWGFRQRFGLRYWSNKLIGGAWGYGESILSALLIGLATILVFSGLYYAWGTPGFGPRGISFPDALLYSAAAFVTIGFADMSPLTQGVKLLTVVESLLGLITFAVFVNALGRRISGR